MTERKTLSTILLSITLILSIRCAPAEDPGFVKEEEAWRESRDRSMQETDSWLTIAGLFWLAEGENRAGTAPGNDIQLPEGSAPVVVGRFIRNDSQVRFEVEKGVDVFLNGNPLSTRVLKSDADGEPDILELNDLRLWVIKREDRYAIRLRDLNALPFRSYHGLTFFPPQEKYRIKGKLIPYETPRKVTISSVVGTKSEMISPGVVSFDIDGENQRLLAFGQWPESGSLFFVFRDGTSGTETYGASRFLTADVAEDTTVDMNFNRAYNPPCAYTKYATCPLPPPENILTIRITAGEMKYDDH